MCNRGFTLELDDAYAEKLLTEMVKIYSPSGEERELALFLRNELSKLGFNVEFDEVGNLIAEAGCGRPSILLCSHMDTVPGKIPVVRKGKVLFGRGTVDAKGPLAALIIAAARHLRKKLSGKITVLAVVDEERRSSGMRWFLRKRHEDYEYAIFGEPSGSRNVTIGYKGRIQLQVRVNTKAGHASAPHLFENAVMKAYELIKNLEQGIWRDKKSPIEDTTFCVTKIFGGGLDNTIPSSCEFTADIRVPFHRKVKEVEAEALEIIEAFKKLNPKVEVLVNVEDRNEPYLADMSSKLVKTFIEAIKEVTGADGKAIKKTGTADVNDFAHVYNVEAVVYGPGNSKLDHAPNENISIPEYLESIKVLEKVLEKITTY